MQEIRNAEFFNKTQLSDEDHLKIVEIWDENTPEGLQKKLHHIIAVELAWRDGEATFCLMSYFKKEVDYKGNSTGRIEYNPIFTKTAQGGDKKRTDSKWLVQNTTETKMCPVGLFKKLLSKRGNIINSDRNPFWKSPESTSWYKNCPIGINQISKWTREAAQTIGIKKAKITDHSNRSTAVSKLAKTGVQEQQLIKITGHKSASSIKPYLQMDPPYLLDIINKMRNMYDIKTTGLSTTANNLSASVPASSAQSSSLNTNVSSNINSNEKQTFVTYTNCNFQL